MGTTPTTTNQAATQINTAISNAMSSGCQAVESMAIAAYPWLGYWFIKPIFEYFLNLIDVPISKALQTGATFAVIDVQTTEEEGSMAAAIAELQAAQKSGNAAAIAKAEKDYLNAQANLVHSDGSAQPS